MISRLEIEEKGSLEHISEREKRRFESMLAIKALLNSKVFLPLLRKIGSAITVHLEDLRKTAARAGDEPSFLAHTGRIIGRSLYNDSYFGALDSKRHRPFKTATNYWTALSILKEAKRIEHLMTVFLTVKNITYSFRHAHSNNNLLNINLRTLEKILASKHLFERRGRAFRHEGARLTQLAGITSPSSPIPYTLQPHKRAADYFFRDTAAQDTFSLETIEKNIPYVAGPSGHTALLLQTAISVCQLVDPLTPQELQEFTFLCFAFLTTAGAHSFHEVYAVAEQIGVDYSHGNYHRAIPFVFLQTEDFQALAAEYPHMLSKDTQQTPLNVKVDINMTPVQHSVRQDIGFFESTTAAIPRKKRKQHDQSDSEREPQETKKLRLG